MKEKAINISIKFPYTKKNNSKDSEVRVSPECSKNIKHKQTKPATSLQ